MYSGKCKGLHKGLALIGDLLNMKSTHFQPLITEDQFVGPSCCVDECRMDSPLMQPGSCWQEPWRRQVAPLDMQANG